MNKSAGLGTMMRLLLRGQLMHTMTANPVMGRRMFAATTGKQLTPSIMHGVANTPVGGLVSGLAPVAGLAKSNPTLSRGQFMASGATSAMIPGGRDMLGAAMHKALTPGVPNQVGAAAAIMPGNYSRRAFLSRLGTAFAADPSARLAAKSTANATFAVPKQITGLIA